MALNHTLVTHIVDGQRIPMSFSQKEYLIKNQIKPEPIRLVMIRWKDNCQFCDEPEGESEALYVGMEYHMGFIFCSKCVDIAKETCENWISEFGYGDAKVFTGKRIKVLRSSGELEDNWELDPTNYYILYDDNGEQCVSCKKIGEDITKCCNVKQIIKWNS